MHSHAPLTNYNLENPSLKHEINIHKTVQSYKINISIDTFLIILYVLEESIYD